MGIAQPKCRQCRRENQKLFLKGDRCYTKACAMDREGRQKPPGQHGERAAQKKMTGYGTQLREKQKLKRIYMVEEGITRRYVAEAERRTGVSGELMMELFERRLDNVVYRLGIAKSRGQARQMVSHGFFQVNGKRVDVPSIRLRIGDVVSVFESKRGYDFVKGLIAGRGVSGSPEWLSWDDNSMSGKVLALPTRDQIDTIVEEQVIIEFYSR